MKLIKDTTEHVTAAVYQLLFIYFRFYFELYFFSVTYSSLFKTLLKTGSAILKGPCMGLLGYKRPYVTGAHHLSPLIFLNKSSK